MLPGEDLAQTGHPPESFVEQVRDALEHLYDLNYLQHHPLAQGSDAATESTTEIAGQRLRRELAAALEVLNPGPGVPLHAPDARVYNVMLLRYMECMMVQEAAREVGISLRQAHRDLRRGEENVAAVLWARRRTMSQQEPSTACLSPLEAELSRLASHAQPIDICHLLQRARQAIQPLAAQRDVRLHVQIPPESVIVSAKPVVAEQMLVNVLSRAVGQARPGTLHLALTSENGLTSLVLRYFPEPEAASILAADSPIAQLADVLGWTLTQDDRSDGTRVVVLHIRTRYATVLVIDDNEGLGELLERYLFDRPCRVVLATDGEEGLQLARELLPNAIVLDVMMPGMQGWEVLQRLRNQPQTTGIPVVVCSVINNPQLALALGASLFLPKPVSQVEFLTALRQLGIG